MRPLQHAFFAASLLLLCAGCSAPREMSVELPPESTQIASTTFDPAEIELLDIVVNVRGSRGTIYFRCSLGLVASLDDHDLIHQNKERLIEKLTERLSIQSVQELDNTAGRDYLRVELAEDCREIIPELGELYVRYKKFLIQ